MENIGAKERSDFNYRKSVCGAAYLVLRITKLYLGNLARHSIPDVLYIAQLLSK